MQMRWLRAIAPYIALVPVLHWIPVPPAQAAPIPWLHATFHAGVLLALMWSHERYYVRWQPAAPRRILINELLARLWFVTYWVLVVQSHTEWGWRFLAMALPWAVLTWEVHRHDVQTRGYRVAWNVMSLGIFLLGLALLVLLAFQAAEFA